MLLYNGNCTIFTEWGVLLIDRQVNTGKQIQESTISNLYSKK